MMRIERKSLIRDVQSLAIAGLAAFPAVTFASGIAFRAVELGSLPGGETVPTRINEAGIVAGRSGSSNIDIGMHAFASDNGAAIQNINNLGFSWSEGQALNDAGQIAGRGCWYNGQDCTNTLYRFSPGTGMQILGCFAGNWGDVHDMNASGDVVGYWRLSPTSWEGHAFLSGDDIGTIDLGTLGGVDSRANAVNDSRQVVGQAGASGTNLYHHAFLWSAGVMKDLGTLGGNWSEALDINNAGQVAGTSATADGYRAFRWTFGGGMQDLQTLPDAVASEAKFINQAGTVVGTFLDAGPRTRTFISTDAAGMVDIGSLPGFEHAIPTDMSESGQIVGLAVSNGYETTAFFWSPETGMVRIENALLDQPAWWINSAIALNDAGQIVASGFNINHGAALLLNPACVGDLDDDRTVGLADLATLLSAFGTTGGRVANLGDLNADGGIDLNDLSLLLSRFGTICP